MHPFALHPFEVGAKEVGAKEVGAKVEIFAFDVLGAVFADMMALRLQGLGVALPVIGVKAAHLAPFQFLEQFLATGIGAAPGDKGGNISGVAVEAIPEPILPLFALHKRPHLI